MMHRLAVILLLVIITQVSFAQSATVKGTITDTIEHKLLPNSAVLLLRSTDSVLVRFARSDKSGNFVMNNLPAGKFILMVNYPTYADYIDQVELKDSSVHDLDKIMMTLKSQLLKEVVVTNIKGAMRIKGDTTEYKADSFKVGPNATVEDLLKKLPGIQVDKDGKITTQGETVQKVLVDGEEFFGDDPTLVTKNLRADMVDKVQVFDKKSDQAAFTGIDDGQKTKTVNIQLKDDKKNGYFGKLSAGAGTDGYHDSQGMFNKFKKKEKISAYAIVSNTGTAGLSWQDQSNFGGGNGYMTMDDQGNISGQDDISGWNGNYNGQGYPLVQTGGLHYNNKWDNEKQSINGNYKAMQLYVSGNSATNSENILPDSSYYQNQQQKFKNQILRNKVSGGYELQIDSSSSIKINVDGAMVHKKTDISSTTASFLVQDSAMLNNGNSTTTTTGDNNTFNGDMLWRKKFKKKGRTISVDMTEKYAQNNSTGFLFSQNNFFKNDTLSFSQLTDQFKTINTKSQAITANAAYSEPLSVISSIVVNYGVLVNNSLAYKNSYNKSGSGKYDVLDDLYSNDYSFNTFTQKGGLFYSLAKKKFRFYAGSNVGFSNFTQHDLRSDTVSKRNFVNWYPQSNISYQFSNQSSLYFSYNGSTTQPSLQQIQPVRNNDDPLNIAVGNSALKPSFRNGFVLNYYSFKPLTSTNIYGRVSYNFTSNYISTNSFTDSLARRVTQYINVNGTYSLDANLNYGIKWKKPDINFNFFGTLQKNRTANIVNGEDNITKSNNYTLGSDINKYKEKKYDFSLQGSATYTSSISSIQSSINTHYWSFAFRPNVDVTLPLKFNIHSEIVYNYRQKTSAFDNNYNVARFDAWIGKKFFKNDGLLVKLSGNDIFNQNKGIERNVSSNLISQTTNSTIQRYFMLSFTWNFTKAGTTAPQGGGMFIVN